MSQEKKQFIVLPNEVIYYIFDFLTTLDILRAFTNLNHRYDDLVRFYIKRIDLIYGWQGDRQELQWICGTIQILKIDRFHIHLLTDYHFPQLDSLHLVDILDWDKVVSNMNLKSLSFWFDKCVDYGLEEKLIPNTVIKLSTNAMVDANAFHMNLIDLSVWVRSIVHLFEIVGNTPNVQHLSVTFADNFDNQYCMENYQADRFETMTTNFHCLNNLNHLSFNTDDTKGTQSNERLPFDQIQIFIDQCCPNTTILKKVTLNFHHIIFYEDMWSTIVRYKNTFDHFNFYASFIVEDKVLKGIEILSTNDNFDFHIEDGDPSHPQARFVHIYSLPFAFNKLYGFISCSDLSPRCSFSAVRHLYFTRTRLAHPISFESLTRRMPHLISINCQLLFAHDCNTTVSDVIIDGEIFYHVRSLQFISYCWNRECVCRSLVPRLLDRMPQLQFLTTSQDAFIHGQRPLPLITQLDMRQCSFEFTKPLARYVPHLSTLLLGHMIIHERDLSQFLGSLFIGIPSLKLISFQVFRGSGNNRTPYRRIAEHALTRVQNMNDRLRHLRLNYGHGLADFSLSNL